MPNIKTYCRIKPTAETYEEHESTKTTLYLRVPEVLKDFASNQKGSRSFVSHEFNFDHIFLQEATQQDVFEVVAEKIVHGKSLTQVCHYYLSYCTDHQKAVKCCLLETLNGKYAPFPFGEGEMLTVARLYKKVFLPFLLLARWTQMILANDGENQNILYTSSSNFI